MNQDTAEFLWWRSGEDRMRLLKGKGERVKNKQETGGRRKC